MPEQPCAFHPDRMTAVTCSRCERPICPEDHHPAAVGIHCPVCAGRMREGALGGAAYRVRTRAERVPVLRMFPGLTATKVLMVVNVGMFLAMFATGAPTSPRTLLRFGALPPVLDPSEWWRLFTAMFVHIGVAHLAFNMFALWLFGHSIEARFGKLRFLLLYFGAGLLGSGASLAFTVGGIRAGASGGVFGILGAWIAVYAQHRHMPGARQQLSSLFFLVGINLFLGFTIPQIDNAAHVGGLIGGFLMGSGVELAVSRRGAWHLAGVAGYALTVVIALVLIVPNTVRF